MYFETKTWGTFSFVLLFSKLFCSSESFEMPYEFQDEFFCFCQKKKKIHWDFDRDYIDLLIDLTSMDSETNGFPLGKP